LGSAGRPTPHSGNLSTRRCPPAPQKRTNARTHAHTQTHPHPPAHTHTHCALHVACCTLHAASCIRASQDPELGVELYYRDGAECSPNVYRQIRWGSSLPRPHSGYSGATAAAHQLQPPATTASACADDGLGLGLAGICSSVTRTSIMAIRVPIMATRVSIMAIRAWQVPVLL
jgi:hypothetical protein